MARKRRRASEPTAGQSLALFSTMVGRQAGSRADRQGVRAGPTLAIFSATRYFCPSFSSSAITQSVMQGVHSAYRQSIMPWGGEVGGWEGAARGGVGGGRVAGVNWKVHADQAWPPACPPCCPRLHPAQSCAATMQPNSAELACTQTLTDRAAPGCPAPPHSP